MTTGSSAQPDLDGGLVAPLAGHDLEPVAALAGRRSGSMNALLGDRRHQLRQVAHDLPRLVRVRIDQVDRDQRGRSGVPADAASAST